MVVSSEAFKIKSSCCLEFSNLRSQDRRKLLKLHRCCNACCHHSAGVRRSPWHAAVDHPLALPTRPVNLIKRNPDRSSAMSIGIVVFVICCVFQRLSPAVAPWLSNPHNVHAYSIGFRTRIVSTGLEDHGPSYKTTQQCDNKYQFFLG